MRKLSNHNNSWRIIALVLLALALSGPWFFDLTWVPPPYFCSAPHIRLDENYCGRPVSVIAFIPWFGRDFIHLAATLVTGAVDPMALLFFLFLLLLALPFFSTLVLILWGGRRRWRTGQAVLLGLAVSASGLVALLRTHWAVWGVWLYLSVAATMFLLEINAWRKQKAQL